MRKKILDVIQRIDKNALSCNRTDWGSQINRTCLELHTRRDPTDLRIYTRKEDTVIRVSRFYYDYGKYCNAKKNGNNKPKLHKRKRH